jgi:hypothetical protein
VANKLPGAVRVRESFCSLEIHEKAVRSNGNIQCDLFKTQRLLRRDVRRLFLEYEVHLAFLF